MSKGLSLGQVSFGRADVARARAEETTRLLLFEDVGRPAGDARTGEHRRRERRRNLRHVEDERGVVLHVRPEWALRVSPLELGERGLFELLGDLDLGRAELPRRA